MGIPQALAPGGSPSLELVQNLAQVLSASSQSRDEELGKVFSAFQALLQEVKQDLTANAKEIAALKTNVATLESEKKQLALTINAERVAFENLQAQVRDNASALRADIGANASNIRSLTATVNDDHKFLHEHFHSQKSGRSGYTGRGTW